MELPMKKCPNDPNENYPDDFVTCPIHGVPLITLSRDDVGHPSGIPSWAWVVIVLVLGVTVLIAGTFILMFLTTNNQPSSQPSAVKTQEVIIVERVITATNAVVEPVAADTEQPRPIEPTETSLPINSPGNSQVTPIDGMEMVYVPEGDFLMGSNLDSDEKPSHKVYLDAFWIDKTEVTNAMYARCVNSGTCELPSGRYYYSISDYASHPVVYVTWNDAVSYCSWAGRRLPTEAEWEKAARGTDGRIYPWGEGINCNKANYYLNDVGCVGITTAVGSYPNFPSPYGAFDMAGNVMEWVNDWYSEGYYASSPQKNPQGPSSGINRVRRGGAWNTNVIITSRFPGSPEHSFDFLGFRCAKSP